LPTLQSITQTVYDQIYPNPSDETPIDFEIFLEVARSHYAYRVWELNRSEVNSSGENNIPSSLLSEAELIVVNKEANISHLRALTSLPNNTWIQSIGGFECGECKYISMDVNKYKLLCDDISRKIGDKAIIPLSNKILFPEGTFGDDEKVSIIYANMGENVEGETLINDALGAMVRTALLKEFSPKFVEDKTNDSNSNK
jgi:hypothetical protein